MADDDVVTRDPWAGLNHKTIMSSKMDQVPRWVPASERRRLTAYDVLSGYLTNNARVYLPPLADDDERADSWQEYGDAALLVRRIRDAVVGEDPGIQVVGADVPIEDGPDLPDFPPPPRPDAMEPEEFEMRGRVYTRQVELWQAQAEASFARWETDIERQPALLARQDALAEWAEDESLIRKIVECEGRNVVALGEGVYALGWDSAKGRPTVEFHDPAAYFPVLDDVAPNEFPTRVHLAWGIVETGPDGKTTEYVRRITYELVPVDQAPEGWERAGYLPDGVEQTHVCLLSDGYFPLDAFRDTTLDGLDKSAEWRTVEVDGVEVELRNYPMGYDFIPLVHVTHDLASASHFGESPIAVLAQLLDEISASDTDESLASRRAARPMITISGMAQASGRTDAERAANNTVDIRPGMAAKVAPGGGIDVVDMAQHLLSIGERIKQLLKRLSVNASVSEGMIGRVDASEVPSGLALTLSFTSFEQMINGARLARAGAYTRLLKFAQRIQIHHAGGWPVSDADAELSTEIYPAEVAFGAFMPQDLAGVVEIITRAVNAYVMSIETAIVMLREAGVPVEDVQAEVAAIRATMGDTAEAIANATGDPGAAAEFLGLAEVDDTRVDVAEPSANGEGPPPVPAGTPSIAETPPVEPPGTV